MAESHAPDPDPSSTAAQLAPAQLAPEPASRGAAIAITVFLGPGSGHLLLGVLGRGIAFAGGTVLALAAGILLLVLKPGASLVAFALLPVLAIAAVVDILRLPRERLGRSRVLPLIAYLGALFTAPVIAAVTLRIFVVEAFKVPSGAMTPTLMVGDHFFVDKRARGEQSAQRGAVIVFPYPANPAQQFVSRVIGLPGDRIEQRGPALFINGWEVPRCHVGELRLDSSAGAGSLDLHLEFLGPSAYLIGIQSLADTPSRTWTVPAGQIYVLGDNRDNSHDSRAWNAGKGGGVPIATINGRATMRFFRRAGAMFSNVDEVAVPVGSESLQPQLEACLAKRPGVELTTPPAP